MGSTFLVLTKQVESDLAWISEDTVLGVFGEVEAAPMAVEFEERVCMGRSFDRRDVPRALTTSTPEPVDDGGGKVTNTDDVETERATNDVEEFDT